LSDGTDMSATDSISTIDSDAHVGCPSVVCSPLKVLVACEYSGAVRDAFLSMGHEAMSCDLLPTDADRHRKPGVHHVEHLAET
jgi:hypothetical protein